MVYYSSGVIWRFSPEKSLGTQSTQPARQSGAPRVRLSITVRQDHSPDLRSCRHSDALRGGRPWLGDDDDDVDDDDADDADSLWRRRRWWLMAVAAETVTAELFNCGAE